MKTRESGMPAENYWDTFFDPPRILKILGLDHADGAVVDIGAGYGTFTLAAARCTRREVFAIDVEQPLLDALGEKARAHLNTGALAEAARTATAAARLMDSFARVATALDRLRNGGGFVTVQHVTVQGGGQAVVAGSVSPRGSDPATTTRGG